MIIKNEKEIDFLIKGLSFFATGGGGLPERGRKRLLDAFRMSNYLEFLKPEELDGSMISACTFYMGSASPDTNEIILKRKRFEFEEIIHENPIIPAIKILENFLGEKIDAIISLETGAGTTAGSFSAASLSGKYFIDGDYVGRAIPEIYQSTPHIYGKNFTPMSAVDKFGNEMVIKNSRSVVSLERIGKMISESSYTSLGMAGIVLSIKDLRDIYIPGTVSRALEVGRILSGENPLKNLYGIIEYNLLFKGKLVRREWEDREGYMEGNHYFNGRGEFEGRTLRIWFRNENHLAWMDGELLASSPDLIVVLREDDLLPLNNTSMLENEKVIVLSLPADEKLKVQKGLDLLGPRHFSFDYDYTPFKGISSQ